VGRWEGDADNTVLITTASDTVPSISDSPEDGQALKNDGARSVLIRKATSTSRLLQH